MQDGVVWSGLLAQPVDDRQSVDSVSSGEDLCSEPRGSYGVSLDAVREVSGYPTEAVSGSAVQDSGQKFEFEALVSSSDLTD